MLEAQENHKLSVQLAKNEKVVKVFNYASMGYDEKIGAQETQKSLVVTTRRIIHEAICDERGNEKILRREMPVSSATQIHTEMRKNCDKKYLFRALIFGILTLTLLSVLLMATVPALLIIALVPAIIGLVNLILFFAKRSVVVSCEIFTDERITSALRFVSCEDNTDPSNKKSLKKKAPEIKIHVNPLVAQRLTNELGAAILDAVAYNDSINASRK